MNNDVLRSLRYSLDLSHGKVVELVKLADPGFGFEKEDVEPLLLKEGDPGYVECSDVVLVRFLEGLVFHRRGKDDSQPARALESRVTNNLVLKKLRVAFELKDTDVQEIFRAAGFEISRPEIGALCRQPGHKNYRPCGDQMLRNFLKGLSLRLRPAR